MLKGRSKQAFQVDIPEEAIFGHDLLGEQSSFLRRPAGYAYTEITVADEGVARRLVHDTLLGPDRNVAVNNLFARGGVRG